MCTTALLLSSETVCLWQQVRFELFDRASCISYSLFMKSISTDDQWKKSRRLLNPAFHIQVLNSYMYAINETSVTCSRELEEAIEENGGGQFDILPIMTRCVLDLLCGNFIEF